MDKHGCARVHVSADPPVRLAARLLDCACWPWPLDAVRDAEPLGEARRPSAREPGSRIPEAAGRFRFELCGSVRRRTRGGPRTRTRRGRSICRVRAPKRDGGPTRRKGQIRPHHTKPCWRT